MKISTIIVSLVFSYVPFLSIAQTAQLFEPNVISDDGIFGFTLSPDGQKALWVKSKGKRDTLVIVEADKVNGEWKDAQLASFSGANLKYKDIDPMFSPDGNTILFQSNRPVPGKENRKGFDIWGVKRTTEGWSQPYHLDNSVNTDSSESYASIAHNGNIYFTKENGTNQGDIFYSEYSNGKYKTAQSLGTIINSKNRDANPYISPEEDYIIYAATKPDNANDSDLVISFRKNNQWTKPVNLGATVNSGLSEFCPFVHQREDRLYFSRLQRGEKRNIENTYYVDNFSALILKLKREGE